jgi:hypothetical protein
MLTLIRIEMRKMVDTRSGLWLLLTIAGISLLIVTAGLFAGDGSDRTLANFFALTLIPVGLILPLLGILTVTTEFTQRTALATFTLVPARHLVAVAKLAAAASYALLSMVTSLALAAIGNALTVALDRGDGGWQISLDVLAGSALFQVLTVVMGVGFGLLLMNSAPAIVLYLVLPTVISILGGVFSGLRAPLEWVDLNQALAPLTDGAMTGDGWARLASAAAVWILLPITLGTARLLHRELS